MRRRSLASLTLALAVAAIATVSLGRELAASAPPKVPANPKKAPTPKSPTMPRNCDDPVDRDRDLDGHPAIECGGDDCDDTDAARFPGVGREVCDGNLPDGRAAANHDEDCNPCTISRSGGGSDGDGDRDAAISASCTNPWTGGVEPGGCEELVVRIDSVDKRVRGGDCDDKNAAVRPGTQICATADAVSLCMPMKGRAAIPSSTAPVALEPKRTTGFVQVPCPDKGKCLAQPDGAGVCIK